MSQPWRRHLSQHIKRRATHGKTLSLVVCPLLLCVAILQMGAVVRGDTEADLGVVTAARKTSTLDIAVDCAESVAWLAVDPTVARHYVPEEFDLHIEPNGAALLLVVAQDCSNVIIDGSTIDPMQMAHMWIRIQGPFVLDPVPGADVTKPTLHFYAHRDFTTSRQFERAISKSGLPGELVDSITLSPFGGPVREITITENATTGRRFSWVSQQSAVPPIAVGVRHHVRHYSKWKPGRTNKNLGKLVELFTVGVTQGQANDCPVEASSRTDSALAPFGSTLHGIGIDFHMHFEGHIVTTKAD